MTLPEPVELLQAIARGDESPEALEHVAAGLRRYFEEGGDLEQYLGLTNARRKKFRNRALLHAAAILADGREVDTWQLAGELAHALRRFDRLRDRHDRTRLGDLDRALFDARNAGCAQLNCRKALAAMLVENFSEKFHGGRDSMKP